MTEMKLQKYILGFFFFKPEILDWTKFGHVRSTHQKVVIVVDEHTFLD